MESLENLEILWDLNTPFVSRRTPLNIDPRALPPRDPPPPHPPKLEGEGQNGQYGLLASKRTAAWPVIFVSNPGAIPSEYLRLSCQCHLEGSAAVRGERPAVHGIQLITKTKRLQTRKNVGAFFFF